MTCDSVGVGVGLGLTCSLDGDVVMQDVEVCDFRSGQLGCAIMCLFEVGEVFIFFRRLVRTWLVVVTC